MVQGCQEDVTFLLSYTCGVTVVRWPNRAYTGRNYCV